MLKYLLKDIQTLVLLLVDFLVKIPSFFMFLRKFLKFDHSKYKGCYIPLEPEFCLDSDFPGFRSLITTHKKI